MTIFILIVVVLVLAGIVGHYRGWFRVTKRETESQAKVILTVDKDKVEQDQQIAKLRMQELERKAMDKVEEAKDRVETALKKDRD